MNKSWMGEYAQERIARSEEFRAAYEVEAALLALVRARTDAGLTQGELAQSLKVSQPYIAQVEKGVKPMSLSLLVRYADVVGLQLTFAQRD